MAGQVFHSYASGYSMPCNERFSLSRSWLPSLNVIGNPTEICASTSGSKKLESRASIIIRTVRT